MHGVQHRDGTPTETPPGLSAANSSRRTAPVDESELIIRAHSCQCPGGLPVSGVENAAQEGRVGVRCVAVIWLGRDIDDRSALSARFTNLVGVSMMSYISEWRTQIARTRLQASAETVASVAPDLGSHSEATFGRAYRRTYGVSPGADRRALDARCN